MQTCFLTGSNCGVLLCFEKGGISELTVRVHMLEAAGLEGEGNNSNMPSWKSDAHEIMKSVF